jgi:hypothetical protein
VQTQTAWRSYFSAQSRKVLKRPDIGPDWTRRRVNNAVANPALACV